MIIPSLHRIRYKNAEVFHSASFGVVELIQELNLDETKKWPGQKSSVAIVYDSTLQDVDILFFTPGSLKKNVEDLGPLDINETLTHPIKAIREKALKKFCNQGANNA